MTNRLDSFFLDRGYRWLIYAVSGVVSILYASINLLALRRSTIQVGLETGVFFCLLLALGIHLYPTLRKVPPATPTSPLQAAHLTSGSIIMVIAIVLGFVITSRSNLLPKLQAAVIDARLEQATHPLTYASHAQSPQQIDIELGKRFQKLQSIADTSYQYQIPVDLNRLGTTEAAIHTSLKRASLSDQTVQAGLVASAKLVDVAALRRTQAHTEEPVSYVINTTVPFLNENIRIKGDHSPISFGGGDFVIYHSTVVFDGMDFQAEKPFREVLFVQGSDSTVIIRNGIIKNLFQTLDGITWINVQFQHSMIKLDGGPITLVNVSFIDCDLRWLAPFGPSGGPVGTELRKKIVDANGQPITFAFEGYSEQIQKPR